ncbi:hypothetical protein EON64_08985 [archaeon]|nr:MAG: hypothetical protein EON64_08985 [archaeon]
MQSSSSPLAYSAGIATQSKQVSVRGIRTMLSKQPTTDESVFAKALTDPDASTRKKTLGALQSYLEQGQSVSHYKLKNFLRLWKILYYTMWLTDKLPIQQEMIESLVGLVDKMQLPQQILFFEAFHVILLKEWNLLDQYRMNKFYLLTRSMLQKLFQLMAEAKWHLTTVSTLRRVLDRVLTTSPNGPRFHIIDIFMEELHKSSIGKVSTGAFLELLHPFLELLQSNVDKVVKQRIRENLVLKLLQMQYPSNQEGCGQPASKPAFPKLSCVALQKKIFQLASDESTLDSSRRFGLYYIGLHT